MIHAVTVTNFKNESLRMPLSKPEDSGLAIFNIEGIGGGTATINSTEMATGDGAWYNSARAQTRNIVLSLKPIDTPSVEENRHKIYRYFPVKKPLQLLFETDTRNSIAYGYVESNDSVIFSQQEYVQISIICADPWFYAAGGGASAFSGVIPMFEFPFSNESTSEKLIEFGRTRIDNRAIIYYEGDVDAGMIITIHALGSAENIMIYNVDTLEHMDIDTDKLQQITGSPFSTGDDIVISTKRGEKYVRLLRNGYYTNIIGAIDRDADWLQLTAGDNLFGFTADYGENNLMIQLNYETAYAGV